MFNLITKCNNKTKNTKNQNKNQTKRERHQRIQLLSKNNKNNRSLPKKEMIKLKPMGLIIMKIQQHGLKINSHHLKNCKTLARMITKPNNRKLPKNKKQP
jgi:hypothetical protein